MAATMKASSPRQPGLTIHRHRHPRAETHYTWLVSVPSELSASGGRRRLHFKTKKEAMASLEKLRQEFHCGSSLPPMPLAPRMEALRSQQIIILSPDQMEALLAAAIEREPSLVPFLAIAGFGGARRSEIFQLRWENIDLEAAGIILDAHITKTASRRRLKMQPNLIEWLRPFAQKSGPVIDPRLARKLNNIRKNLCTHCGIGKWPINGLRHSFGSYCYELFGVEETMREMGHASRDMLENHFRRLVTPQAAKRFFAIFPPKDLAEIVAEYAAKQARNSAEAQPTISSI